MAQEHIVECKRAEDQPGKKRMIPKWGGSSKHDDCEKSSMD